MNDFNFASEQEIKLFNERTLKKILQDTEELGRKTAKELLERIKDNYKIALEETIVPGRQFPSATFDILSGSLRITEKRSQKALFLEWIHYGELLEKGAPPEPDLPYSKVVRWLKQKAARYGIVLYDEDKAAERIHKKLKEEGYEKSDLLLKVIKRALNQHA